MELTQGQEQALKIAVQRYRDNELYTCISGPAGSGKSTLIRFIIAALNIPEEYVVYATFTGKAAQVLKQKGCHNAITLHKLLYKARQNADGTYSFYPKKELDERYDLIVIDEISMVSKTLWDLLLTHHIHVLCLGDEAQLPPVAANEDNHVLDNPHYHLTEILRQAQESEIIRVATHVREGNPLYTFKPSQQQVMFINKSNLVEGHYIWADQILCAKNETRNLLNKQVRSVSNSNMKYQSYANLNEVNNNYHNQTNVD